MAPKDANTLRFAMVVSRFEPKKDHISNMIICVDDNGSGTIEYEEALKMMVHKILNRSPKAETFDTFRLFDNGMVGVHPTIISSACISFRRRAWDDDTSLHYVGDFVVGMGIGLYYMQLLIQSRTQHHISMNLFYFEAPERNVNQVIKLMHNRGEQAMA